MVADPVRVARFSTHGGATCHASHALEWRLSTSLWLMLASVALAVRGHRPSSSESGDQYTIQMHASHLIARHRWMIGKTLCQACPIGLFAPHGCHSQWSAL